MAEETIREAVIASAIEARGPRLMAIQVDDWMFAPDGQQYRVIFGLAQVVRAKDLLGFEPRNSANWWVLIGEGEGSMLIAGCRIHYAQDVISKPAGSHVYEVKSANAIEIICNPSPAQKAGEELLEALKKLVASIEAAQRGDMHWTDHNIPKARAVIAKAEGRV